jgi:hypothetical protein
MLNNAELSRLTKDVKKAERRVGDRAKWLLDFAYRDLSKLDKQGAVDLGLEILAFAVAEYKPELEFSTGPFAPLPYLYDYFKISGMWSDQRGGFVDVFQSELRKRFDECKQRRWWEYREPGITERFTVFRGRSTDGNFYGDFAPERNQTALDILLGLATKVVKRERERFAICENPRCGVAFVSERKRRAKYHEPRCAAYVRVNRSRGKEIK